MRIIIVGTTWWGDDKKINGEKYVALSQESSVKCIKKEDMMRIKGFFFFFQSICAHTRGCAATSDDNSR